MLLDGNKKGISGSYYLVAPNILDSRWDKTYHFRGANRQFNKNLVKEYYKTYVQ